MPPQTVTSMALIPLFLEVLIADGCLGVSSFLEVGMRTFSSGKRSIVCSTASTFSSACRFLHQRSFDIFFVDIDLPDGGIELIRRIKWLEEVTGKKAALIVCSTDAPLVEIQEAQEAGADMFFSRPDNIAGVIQALQALPLFER